MRAVVVGPLQNQSDFVTVALLLCFQGFLVFSVFKGKKPDAQGNNLRFSKCFPG